MNAADNNAMHRNCGGTPFVPTQSQPPQSGDGGRYPEEVQLIDAVSSRHYGSTEPLLLHPKNEQSALLMFDGSGSWGTGVEAASWFRDWPAMNGNCESREAVNASLRCGIDHLPLTITDDDFHWSFSIVVAIVQNGTVQIGASGGFAAVMHSNSSIKPLFTPARFIDELVAHGHVSESDAEGHKYANILCGPFFGVDDQVNLTWSGPRQLYSDSQVLIGGPALQRYLTANVTSLSQIDPQSLHDAVDRYAGVSTPTAIITPDNSG